MMIKYSPYYVFNIKKLTFLAMTINTHLIIGITFINISRALARAMSRITVWGGFAILTAFPVTTKAFTINTCLPRVCAFIAITVAFAYMILRIAEGRC